MLGYCTIRGILDEMQELQITSYSLFRAVLKKFYISIAAVFVGQIVFGLVMINTSYFARKILASFNAGTGMHQAIINLVTWNLTVWIGVYIFNNTLVAQYKPKIQKFLVDTLSEHMIYQGKHYFAKRSTGDILPLISDISGTLPEIIYSSAALALTMTVVVSAIVFSFTVHSYIGFIVLSWLTMMITLQYLFGLKGMRLAKTMTINGMLVQSNLGDIINNMSQVRSVCSEEHEITLVKRCSEEARISTTKVEVHFLIIQTFQMMSFFVVEALVYTVASGMHSAGILPLEGVVQLAAILGLANLILWMSSRTLSTLLQMYGGYNITVQMLGTPVTQHGSQDTEALEGTIDIVDLTFSHPDVDGLFKNLNLHIAKGEKVGLVGRSGSGKTTLANLIMGHECNNYKGNIMVGGVNIKNISIPQLRRCFAFVPQRITLFQRSIWGNIAYGTPNATDEGVVQAAKYAYAHNFIVSLPDGYQTILNMHGIELSGGQQQRLMLARALLRLQDSNILIVDEGTSALDNETERDIKIAMAHAMKGKTAIVIAHRLSTLQQMDRIVVFDHGRVVEEGKHQDLLVREGSMYRALWNAQLM